MEKRSSNWLLVLYGYLQIETRISVVRNKYWLKFHEVEYKNAVVNV